MSRAILPMTQANATAPKIIVTLVSDKGAIIPALRVTTQLPLNADRGGGDAMMSVGDGGINPPPG